MPNPMIATQGSSAGNRSPNVGTPQAQSAGPRVGFSRAAKHHIEPGASTTFTLSTSTQLFNFKVPVYGYIDAVYLRIQATTSGNSAAVAYAADAPWSVIRNILYKDANGTPLVNLSGYQAYLMALLGGYRVFKLDGSSLAYSAVTGTGGTGGSFTIFLPIFSCFGRDGLGALPNMDASSQYLIDVTIDTSTNVYSTPPTAQPSVTIQPFLWAWTNPPQSDQFGNANITQPPAYGSVQFWSAQQFAMTTGENTHLLSRVGNFVRNHILVYRNSSGARDATVMPAGNIQWEWDAGLLYTESVLLNQFKAFQWLGFDLPTGVLAYPYTMDPEQLQGAEHGDMWIPTLGTTKLLIRHTPQGTPGNLEVLTNDFVAQGNPFAMG